MGDGIVLLLSFLAFEGDGNVIGKFNVGMCVWDDLSSLEESNVSEPNLQCLTLFGLWDFEILARPECKEDAQPRELNDGLVEFRDLLLGKC
jgi:hypothetical protein